MNRSTDAAPPAATSHIAIRSPELRDAPRMWDIVNESGVLDRNSCYLYLLLCRDFGDSCAVAEADGDIVGFVTGYRPPQRPETLFIWQVAVLPQARRRGLATQMIRRLLQREHAATVKYLEATVAPSNDASARLFQSLAADWGVPCTQQAGFLAADFGPTSHEDEPVLRIGPISTPR